MSSARFDDMVGWLDTVALGEAIRTAGATEIAINKLDALNHRGDWKGELKICVGYKDKNGNTFFNLPADETAWRASEPIFREFPGWNEDISRVRCFMDLPLNARRYVAGVYYHIIANSMGAQMVKEVASKTSDIAGDGTTTATVLAQALIREGMKAVAAGMNPMDLKRGIDKAVIGAVDELKKLSKPCNSSKEIAQVGSISANSDENIGDLIAKAMSTP